jgi:hypothetical protein
MFQFLAENPAAYPAGYPVSDPPDILYPASPDIRYPAFEVAGYSAARIFGGPDIRPNQYPVHA